MPNNYMRVGFVHGASDGNNSCLCSHQFGSSCRIVVCYRNGEGKRVQVSAKATFAQVH